jgi:hypothetical protein
MVVSYRLTQALFSVFVVSLLSACGGGGSSSGGTSTETTTDMTTAADCTIGLHDAFNYFGDNVEVALSADGCEVVVTTNSLPDHASFYWNPTHPLYEEPTASQAGNRTPTVMDDSYANDVSLTVPVDPALALFTTGTSLGAVGIAVSGGYIYNKNEAGNEPIDVGTAAGLDSSGAHIGPTVYHYHMEPKKISEDSQDMIGIIADGFFIYGRRCWSLTGETPSADELDDSGGHTAQTQYSNGIEEYHYHIMEESFYLDTYYLLFPGDYQGTPNNIGA